MPKIAVILPSRGLIFAEVLESLVQELAHYDYRMFICHDKVIPDSLNHLVNEAGYEKFTHYLFIEEDTVPPTLSVGAMLTKAEMSKEPCVVCVDYPLYNGASSIWRNENNEIIFCGFGCTLVDARIMSSLSKPYFRTDMELVEAGGDTRWQKTERVGYGRHDIYFFKTVTEKGYKIYQLEDFEAKHLELKKMGEPKTNKGLHEIGLKADKITQRYTL